MELRGNNLILFDTNFIINNNLTRFLRQNFDSTRDNIIKPPINLRVEDQVDYLRGLEIYLSACYKELKLYPKDLTEKECYFTAVVAYDWNDLNPLIRLYDAYNKADDGYYWFWLAGDSRFASTFNVEIYRRKTYSTLNVLDVGHNYYYDLIREQLESSSEFDSDGKKIIRVSESIAYRKEINRKKLESTRTKILKLGNVVIAGDHVTGSYVDLYVYYNLRGPLPAKIQEALVKDIHSGRRVVRIGSGVRYIIDFIEYLRHGDPQLLLNKGYDRYINLNNPDLASEIKQYLANNPRTMSLKLIGDEIYYMYKVPHNEIDIFIYGDVDLPEMLDRIEVLVTESSSGVRGHYISYSSHARHINIKNYKTNYRVHKIKFNKILDVLAYMDVDSRQILAYYDQDVKVIATEAYGNSLLYDRNLVVPTHQSSAYNYNLIDQLHCYPDIPNSLVYAIDWNSKTKPNERTYRGLFELLNTNSDEYVDPLDVKLAFVNDEKFNKLYKLHRLVFSKFVVDLSSGIITNSLDFNYISYFEGRQKYEYPNLREMELGKYLPKVLLDLVTRLETPNEEEELEDLEKDVATLS